VGIEILDAEEVLGSGAPPAVILDDVLAVQAP